MSLNIEDLLAGAKAQAEAQAALNAALQATMQNPAVLRRINVSMTAVANEGPQKVVMIAMPSGERIDLPLPPNVAKAIAKQLAEDPPGDVDGEAVEADGPSE